MPSVLLVFFWKSRVIKCTIEAELSSEILSCIPLRNELFQNLVPDIYILKIVIYL